MHRRDGWGLWALVGALLIVAALRAAPAKARADLPDLRVAQVRIELETGSDCDDAGATLGLRIWIENAGTAAAGAFVVEANGNYVSVALGIEPHATVAVWFPDSYVWPGDNRVLVDALNQVTESNEENNLFLQMVAIPTPPPTCTPSAAHPARVYLPLLLR